MKRLDSECNENSRVMRSFLYTESMYSHRFLPRPLVHLYPSPSMLEKRIEWVWSREG